jgi:NOL1/NOP2/fmu family ribosome biogenesis protein
MLADDLMEDARHLGAKGDAEKRASCMRRAISTAYYAVFHLLIEDFVEHWEFEDQRARLARMFNHQKMRDAAFTSEDKKNPTSVETDLIDVIRAFGQLQKDRHRADYDLGWNIVGTDVADAITLAEDTFTKWRAIRGDDVARHHLLSMFGANR